VSIGGAPFRAAREAMAMTKQAIERTTPDTEPLKPERIQRRPQSTETAEERAAGDQPEDPAGRRREPDAARR
jgi:hypothetical protein